MATAEEILASSYSTDSAADGNFLVISEDLRTIGIPSGQEVLGVFCDADVRRVWFAMPSECDGADLSGFSIYVNYRNAGGKLDRYPVTDAKASGGVITFSWLVSRRAFETAGEVTFNVCLMEYASDGETVTREFNTTTATMEVLEGLEATAAAMNPYTDAVAQLVNAWELRIRASEATAAAATSNANGAASNAVVAAAAANSAAQAANAAAAATANVVSEAVSALSRETGSEADQIRVMAVELVRLKDDYMVLGETLYTPSSRASVSGETLTRKGTASVSGEKNTID